MRPLKSAKDPLGVDYNAIGSAFFSLDGKYLAINPYKRDARERVREVLVIDLEADREFLVAAAAFNDILVGWTPDGKQLVMLRERPDGISGLRTISFDNGQSGTPTPIVGAGACAVCQGRGGGPNRAPKPGSFGDILGLDSSGPLYYRILSPGQGREQVWVLENFLPKEKAVR
jgi:hypothetical protein